MKFRVFFWLVIGFLPGPGLVVGQSPGVPIEVNGDVDAPAILEKARVLREAGKFVLTMPLATAQLQTPVPSLIQVPSPNTQPLSGRDIAGRARQSHIRFGWYFLCKRCDHWHLNLAGAYAVAEDAVATCYHCVDPIDQRMKEGFLIAVDPEGNVLVPTVVLAKSRTLDAAILRVEGPKIKPLPLSDNVAPGDPAFCFSTPLGQRGYFSEGIVNRFYWLGGPAAVDPNSWKNLRVNVSTDWAPGSSGAAVLDQCGNAIGHVSTISPLSEGPRQPPSVDGKPPVLDRFGGATLITLHDAVPARGLLALVESLKKADAAALVKTVPKVDLPDLSDPGLLQVGDRAPQLEVGSWLQGETLAELQADKVYLVDFWATWCGPCKETVPLLNQLQAKFGPKGLVVLGVNCQEPAPDQVGAFLKDLLPPIRYAVALDSTGGQPWNGKMYHSWVQAAGCQEFPTAFLIDAKGRIAWIGHPAKLKDEMVEQVLSGNFDLDQARRQAAEDRFTAKVIAKFEGPLGEAVALHKADDFEKLATEMDKALLPKRKSALAQWRFRFALAMKNSTEAAKFAALLSAAPETDAEGLNALAWSLVTEDLPQTDLSLAEQLARKSLAQIASDQRPRVQDTLARVMFLTGRKDEATRLESEAVAGATDEVKAALSTALEAYRRGELPPAK